MGCDIHSHVEVLKDGKWINADAYSKSGDNGQLAQVNPVRSRWYALFTQLAGVRDYTGLADKVSEPKGFPVDASPETISDYEMWGGDAHTRSWLTLDEIEKFRESKPVMRYKGWISPSQALSLDRDGVIPDSWCQETSNNTYMHRKWSVEIDTLDELSNTMRLFAYQHRSWDAKDIRLVFWFDN